MKIPIGTSTTFRGRNVRPNWLVLFIFVAVALAVGAAGAAFSPGFSASTSSWYTALDKPSWIPPTSWFGPIWTLLYVLMGVAGWLVWHERYHQYRTAALSAYAIQLFLNSLWAPVFFGAKNVGAGLFLIIALWLSIIWAIREFARVKRTAAVIMMPYIVWVSIAALLNLSIWRHNS